MVQGSYQPVISMMQSVHQLADDILHLPSGPCRVHAVLQGCIQQTQMLAEYTRQLESEEVCLSRLLDCIAMTRLEDAYFAHASPLAQHEIAQQLTLQQLCQSPTTQGKVLDNNRHHVPLESNHRHRSWSKHVDPTTNNVG